MKSTTKQDLIEWGRQEHEARVDDLARVAAGSMSLDDAKRSSRVRASRAGMTIAQADKALRAARIARSK